MWYNSPLGEILDMLTSNQPARETIVCKDNFKMSVQASRNHYCHPKENGIDISYTSVEVGFPTEKEDLLMDWAEDGDKPTETVYAYVPVGVVIDVIEKHGGIDSGQLPEFDLTNYKEKEER